MHDEESLFTSPCDCDVTSADVTAERPRRRNYKINIIIIIIIIKKLLSFVREGLTVHITLFNELEPCRKWLIDNKLALHLGKPKVYYLGRKIN